VKLYIEKVWRDKFRHSLILRYRLVEDEVVIWFFVIDKNRQSRFSLEEVNAKDDLIREIARDVNMAILHKRSKSPNICALSLHRLRSKDPIEVICE